MGIPAFYRWLIDRYPRSVVDVLEDSPSIVNGVRIPVDATKPNPNGFEFDNLYLDMNGIIHPCFHPVNWPVPKTYEEVFEAVFKYIDRIFSMIRPRKLLFMAIDGVAPRAKMNQQRSRRFRSAKDAADAASLKRQVCDNTEKDGSLLDSNVITPGTEFMELLSTALQFYVHLRINTDPSWKRIKVILSDATVPGEGEHKIMSYIRLQRNLPGFDPNTRHCLYGLDADLIMLALATHEVHFSVLREDVLRAPPKSRGHNTNKRDRNGILKPDEPPSDCLEDIISRQQFQLVNIWILRDYLAESLRIPDRTVKMDLERLIDDFVFMCLFVGNDFLPHVPSLEISEGAIDLLMLIYKKEFVRMGGYLTNASEVNLKGVEHFVQTLGSHENAIFKKRRQAQISFENRLRRFSAKIQDQLSSNPDEKVEADKVNLGEEGWKERYYSVKFEAQSDEDRERVKNHAVLKYVEGICWFMHYYYQGVCSWQWFYPYHYAPFASDFQGLDMLNIHFELGQPFKPFDQLMGVLPAASAGALPSSYRRLMTDQSSPILDLYPIDFSLDLNGRRQSWKAICKLPFIDEARLLSEIAKVEDTLTDVERRRNTLGIHKLFVDMSHPLAAKIFVFKLRNKDNPKLHKAKVKTRINPKFSGGMNGYIYISDQPVCPPEIPTPLSNMKTITENKVLVVSYKFPDLHPHIPRPPKGVKMPPKSVGRHDLPPPPALWHEKSAQGRFTSRPIPPKSIAGSCLAKISHQLVSRISSSENRGNVAKIQNQLVSGICSNDDGGNVAKPPDQLISGVNCSKDRGNANKQSHDALNQSGENKKKRRRKKRSIPPNSNAGSCPDQLVSGIYNSKDGGNEAEIPDQLASEIYRSGNQGDVCNQGDALSQSEDGGNVEENPNQLVSRNYSCEDQENTNKQSNDALNQSGEKKKKRKKRRTSQESVARSCPDQLVCGIDDNKTGGNVAKLPHQLVSGIHSSEDQGDAKKQSHDALNQSEDGGNAEKNPNQLVSENYIFEDQNNANKRSHNALNQSGEKKKKTHKRHVPRESVAGSGSCPDQLVSSIHNSEMGGDVSKLPHQFVSGTHSNEDQGDAKQSHDAPNQSEDGGDVSKIPDSSGGQRDINKQILDALNKSEARGNEAKIPDQLVSGIHSSKNQGGINQQSHDALNQTKDGGNMSKIPDSSGDQGHIDKQTRDALNKSEDGGNDAKIPDQLIPGINSSEKQGHDALNQSGNKKKRHKKKRKLNAAAQH